MAAAIAGGCGGDDGPSGPGGTPTPLPEGTTTASTESVAATATRPAEPGAAVDLARYEDQYEDPGGFLIAREGSHLELAEVTLEKQSEGESGASTPFEFELEDSKGTRYKPRATTIDFGDTEGSLSVGDKIRGLIIFEVTDGATGSRLFYAPGQQPLAQWDLD
jgi:hypothetical protein